MAGQLLDGKKGVDFGQVGRDALGGAAGSIPLVGGMLQNKITGGGAQGQVPQAPGMPQVPGAVGPGGFGGLLGQGGQGLMGMAGQLLSAENGVKTPGSHKSPTERGQTVRRGTDPNKVMWGARGVTYDPNVDYNPYDESMQFQEGQMIREGRGPAEQALTRDQFALQRMGYDTMPLPPLDKEGNIYESNPHARKQIMERRKRGGSPMQGTSQQVEYDLMDYEDRMKEINDAYSDYFSRRSVVEPKNSQYSFQEGAGGEGGTLTIQNAQRQFNGGAVSNNKQIMKNNGVRLMKRGGGVYADNGVKTPGEPTEPKEPYDGRSYFQRFADEAGQIAAGFGGLDDSLDRQSNLGMTGSTGEKSVFDMLSRIPSDFMRAYLKQEESDRAREESGQKGRVDAFGEAFGAFDRALEGDAPAYIGGPETTSVTELTPFSAAKRAYERSRMTEAARNESRQFAGGRAPVRLMKRR